MESFLSFLHASEKKLLPFFVERKNDMGKFLCREKERESIYFGNWSQSNMLILKLILPTHYDNALV
jgi:hypothetical protein